MGNRFIPDLTAQTCQSLFCRTMKFESPLRLINRCSTSCRARMKRVPTLRSGTARSWSGTNEPIDPNHSQTLQLEFSFCEAGWMRIVVVLLSVLLIFGILLDAFESIVLPRRVTRRFRITRVFYRTTWIPSAAFA